MKVVVKGMGLLLVLLLAACATTKEPRKPPHCTGEYERINSADKYPTEQGK